MARTLARRERERMSARDDNAPGCGEKGPSHQSSFGESGRGRSSGGHRAPQEDFELTLRWTHGSQNLLHRLRLVNIDSRNQKLGDSLAVNLGCRLARECL